LHVDNPDNNYVSELLSLLNTFNLTQHVQEKTHVLGHTLDLVITRGIDISVTVKDLALSDHYCIFFDVFMSSSYSSSTAVMIEKELVMITQMLILNNFSSLNF